MGKKLTFNPISGEFDYIDKSIPQYDSDPSSPNQEDVWVRKSTTGTVDAQPGLLPIMLSPNAAGTTTYELSYRTKEDTTVRVEIS